MCDYCSKKKPKGSKIWLNEKDFKNNSLAKKFDAIIEGNKLKFNYDAYSCDSSFSDEIEIKFCPMCGRSL